MPPTPKKNEEIVEAVDESVTEEADNTGVYVIENNGYSCVHLPATESHPLGKKLIPGLNNVPKLYWNELLALKKPNRPGSRQPFRFPFREALAQLLEPVEISQHGEGSKFCPRITIFERDQVEVEGPPAPFSLVAANYPPDVATKIIAWTNDRPALRRWAAERGQKKEVVAECKKRLELLGG